MTAITLFRNEYAFLSNFYACEIKLGLATYQTAEHAFQAMKAANATDVQKIRLAETPGQAKRLGRKVEMVPYWEDVKVNVMYEIIWIKFNDHEHLKEALLETGHRELVEGNTWGDRFWGMCEGEGENMLGKILMDVRAWIRVEDIIRRVALGPV